MTSRSIALMRLTVCSVHTVEKVVLSHHKATIIRFKTTFLMMTYNDFGSSHTVKNELDLTRLQLMTTNDDL